MKIFLKFLKSHPQFCPSKGGASKNEHPSLLWPHFFFNAESFCTLKITRPTKGVPRQLSNNFFLTILGNTNSFCFGRVLINNQTSRIILSHLKMFGRAWAFSACLSVCKTEDNPQCYGRHPLIEDDLWWKMTFDGRRPLIKDDHWWKTTFDGR